MRRFIRAGMRAAAVDETAATVLRSALVLAPHPDDETLGCGATILRKVAAGTPVTVAVLTDGRHSHSSEHLTPETLAALRRVEMADAAARLGLGGAVRWAGFVDGTLSDNQAELADFIGGLLAELRPDELYATSAVEPHPDHAALGRAARQAVAAAATPVRLLEYPVWLWGSWPLRRGERIGSTLEAAGMVLRRQVTRVSVDEHLAGKLNALDAHRSQLARPDGVPGDAPWAVLPAALLAAVREPAELFLPWRPESAA